MDYRLLLVIMICSFEGIYPAFMTPLDARRNFVPQVAERLLKYLLSAGVDGTYVAGSTGEGLLLPVEIRKAIVETLMPLLPDGKKMIVHVGAQDLRVAVDLAQHAARLGAHAISSLPPVGGREAVRDYYVALAKESPLPLLLYYFPKAVPTAFTNTEDLIEVCDLPNVLGVKFTDFNLYLLERLVARGKTIFNGYDEVLAAGLLMGAQGGIGSTYNIMPQVYLEIARAAQLGDWETSRRWQRQANRVIETLIGFPFAAVLRAVMRHRGFDCGPSMKVEPLSAAAEGQLFAQLDHSMTTELKSIIEWREPVMSER
jgi:N-acetylneuraminate lyase